MPVRISANFRFFCTFWDIFIRISKPMNFKHIYFFLVILYFLPDCTGKKEGADEKNTPVVPISLNWTDTVKKLGIVQMGDTVRFAFVFRNTGSYPAAIEKAESSCSCTEALAPEKPAGPGNTDSIRMILYTQKAITGSIRKTVRVTVAGSKQVRLLVYEAEIKGHKKLPGT